MSATDSTAKQEHPDLISEFRKCLGTMSHSRAGWDYQLSREQRAKEDREEHDALARVRAVWSENPGLHEELRAAFKAESPLAQMAEIERAPATAQSRVSP